MKKKRQTYKLTEDQLEGLIGKGTHPGAEEAYVRVEEIKEKGGAPAIYYSEFNQFTVVDEDDPKQIDRALSLEQRSRPFRM